MFDRLFLAHPRAVGESYRAHQRVALGVGLALLGAGLASLVHALVPGLCERTASRTIQALNTRIRARTEA
jgi:hypothetical protein